MGSFIFVLTPPDGDRHDLEGDAADGHVWVARGPCRTRIANDGNGPRATLVDSPAGLAAGLVRLDNRHEISRLAQCEADQSDLAIIVAALARHGVSCIRQFEGDFAFVYWDCADRTLIAARDALGIRLLYRSDGPFRRSFASRAQLLGAGRPWSLDYIADCLADSTSRTFTPYEGVVRVPAGTYQLVREGNSTEHRYWSPYHFDTTWKIDSPSAIEQFATLFKDAMRVHLNDDSRCWSHLSGGMDSSSLVSMAGWLAKVDCSVPELSGTLTFVDTAGIGDERMYSNAVIRDWSFRNEQIIDYRMWQDGEAPPPETDELEATYPLFARDQVVSRIVRSSGSRILLTGVGPDYYLHGNSTYFTDWIARGRVRDAVRDMYREAVRNRASFWKLAYHHGIKPFLTNGTTNSDRWPDWVHPSFARRFPVGERHGWGEQQPGRTGRRFVTEAANIVNLSEFAVSRGLIGDTLDVRCPFLYRPLVEFCLQLPPEMKVRDGTHKWILREAMQGLLPEEVRRRTSKGFVTVGIDNALTVQHERLDALLERSVLGDMECIDVQRARTALTQRVQSSYSDSNRLENLLRLETWLTVKTGRWIASDAQ